MLNIQQSPPDPQALLGELEPAGGEADLWRPRRGVGYIAQKAHHIFFVFTGRDCEVQHLVWTGLSVSLVQ